MDPNRVWEDIMVDISLLYDLLHDEDAAELESRLGTSPGEVRSALITNLESLRDWIAQGGFPPDPYADAPKWLEDEGE
jgi:hypothetical protein